MQQIKPHAPHDPAPSRVKYKLERLWLTPVYRALIRTGIPVLFVLVAFFAWIRDPAVQQKIVSYVDGIRQTIEQRPEFMVQQMRIQGASGAVDKQVRAAMGITLPVSSFRLDMKAMKAKVEAIDAVESASLLIGAKGVLQVGIVERVPVLVWRSNDGLVLLDANGQKSGRIGSRLERPSLPLIAGDGARTEVAEAQAIFKKLTPIAERVRGLMRMGQRRWDVILDRNQVLKLPEKQPIAALGRILALNRAQDILNRDILVVDIRDGLKPILRLTPTALNELKQLRLIAAEGTN
ncbi:MAG: cell division protein FtsQ/DivIB [Rhodobacterales bacterium]